MWQFKHMTNSRIAEKAAAGRGCRLAKRPVARFDEAAHELGIDKIKIVDDAYMAVSPPTVCATVNKASMLLKGRTACQPHCASGRRGALCYRRTSVRIHVIEVSIAQSVCSTVKLGIGALPGPCPNWFRTCVK